MKVLKNWIGDKVKFIKQYVKNLEKESDEHDKELKNMEKGFKKIEETKPDDNNMKWSTKAMLRFWLTGLFIVFIGYVFFKSLNIIYLIITAFIISIAMEAIINFFQKARLHRWIAIAISYILLIAFVLSGFLFIIPFILTQVSMGLELLSKMVSGWIPNFIENPYIVKILESFGDPEVIETIKQQLQNNISSIVRSWASYAKDLGNLAVWIFAGFAEFVAQASIVLVLSVLFSIEKKSVIKFIAWLGGVKKYKYLYVKLERLYTKLWMWLKGQLMLCLFIWLTMFLALWILALFGIDLPQKWSLAVIAWLMEIIPYIWPTLGWLPAVLVALIHYGPVGALIMMGIIVVVQWLENNVLIPLVMNKTLGVNPVTIFISMILWGLIMWFVGVLLSVPIAVIVTIIINDDF